ncbi:MAG: hypothetical protein J7L89_02590, partial [Bacteroidales bacterium]|nr:hypothetical protein [Bacteroidales bacterium]
MKRISVFIGFLVAVISLSAQQSNDYGIFLGMTQEHIHTILPVPVPGTNQVAAGAYYRYNFNPRYAMHFGARAGFGSNISFLQQLDLYGVVEFNFLPMNPRKKPPQLSTFIGTGLGLYQQTLAIPFDIGLKYQITPRLG